ncbi:MAG TPA: hypothetical protein VFQ80_17635 [Thermomicrobiales bacterium]|nr:hypothetical protein [Thermomicrobiales bacterium]
MDDRSFDAFAKSLVDRTTRRTAVKTLAAGAFGVSLVRLQREDAAAKKRCRNTGAVCSPVSPNACCSGALTCCPPYIMGGETEPQCAPKGALCCTPSQAGGYCDKGDQCCETSPRWRFGICESAEGECCTDEWWGSCPSGTHCCNDPEPASCCPNTTAASGVEGRHHVARNYRRRKH